MSCHTAADTSGIDTQWQSTAGRSCLSVVLTFSAAKEEHSHIASSSDVTHDVN